MTIQNGFRWKVHIEGHANKHGWPNQRTSLSYAKLTNPFLSY